MWSVLTLQFHAKIVRSGDLRGIRLPKPRIEQAGLDDEVDPRFETGRS